MLGRDKARDVGEVAGAEQDDAALPAGGGGGKQLAELHAGLMEEREGMAQIGRGQPRFLGKALRRQVVGVAPGGGLTHLDQPLAHTPLEVRVGEAKGDAELAGDGALGDVRVAVDDVEHAQHDLVARLGVALFTHL